MSAMRAAYEGHAPAGEAVERDARELVGIVGLQFAAARGLQQLAIALLFTVGLLLGLGAYGYATRRDVFLFWRQLLGGQRD